MKLIKSPRDDGRERFLWLVLTLCRSKVALESIEIASMFFARTKQVLTLEKVAVLISAATKCSSAQHSKLGRARVYARSVAIYGKAGPSCVQS